MQQQTLQQIINITVGDTSASGSLANTGTPVLPIIAMALTLIAAVVAIGIFTSRRHKLDFSTSHYSSHHTSGYMNRHSGGTLRSLAIALGLGASITTLAFVVPAAQAAPTLAIQGNTTLAITIPQGGGTATTNTTITTSTANPSGYTLIASLATAEPGISIALKGGSVTTNTNLTAGATPLTLATTDSANATGSTDNTNVELTFTVDSTVTTGTKTLTLNYVAEDNTPAVPQTMQALTKSYCTDQMVTYDGTNEEAILTLADPRGNTTAEHQTYQVAKLADGNCWMLNNLKLGSTAAPTTLTPADTNIAANFELPQLTTTGTTDYDNPGAYGPVPGDTGAGETNYGYLYNWSAATAGESRTSHPETAGNAQYSICPANWRLPNGGLAEDPNNEFSQLNAKMAGFTDNQDATYQTDPYQYFANWQPTGPFKGAFAGVWWEGFYGQGAGGGLWSGSASPDWADRAWSASFDSGGVGPGVSGNRVDGFGVRCLLN